MNPETYQKAVTAFNTPINSHRFNSHRLQNNSQTFRIRKPEGERFESRNSPKGCNSHRLQNNSQTLKEVRELRPIQNKVRELTPLYTGDAEGPERPPPPGL